MGKEPLPPDVVNGTAKEDRLTADEDGELCWDCRDRAGEAREGTIFWVEAGETMVRDMAGDTGDMPSIDVMLLTGDGSSPPAATRSGRTRSSIGGEMLRSNLAEDWGDVISLSEA